MQDKRAPDDSRAMPPAARRPPRQPAPPAAVDAVAVHGDDVPLGAAAVLDPADVRQDGAAGARRLAVGVGGGDVLLPGRAAGRLLLRAPPHPPCSAPADAASSTSACACWPSSCCRSDCRRAGASRRRASPICGSSACSRSASACRSSPSPPTRRCCRPGSPRTGHPHGRDPYFLYAASNLGSLIALLGYPFAARAGVRPARR